MDPDPVIELYLCYSVPCVQWLSFHSSSSIAAWEPSQKFLFESLRACAEDLHVSVC
jgi:hypothetical protein